MWAVGILAKHGPVGVLGSVRVEPKVRRLTHGTLLATQRTPPGLSGCQIAMLPR